MNTSNNNPTKSYVVNNPFIGLFLWVIIITAVLVFP